MSSASDLADMLEMGEGTKIILSKPRYNQDLDQEIAAMTYRHSHEEEMMHNSNSYMHPDCYFREYDWDAMYDEDRYCSDQDYIPSLKSRLRKVCSCPNHS